MLPEPFSILIDSEQIAVKICSGATPQTVTITRAGAKS